MEYEQAKLVTLIVFACRNSPQMRSSRIGGLTAEVPLTPSELRLVIRGRHVLLRDTVMWSVFCAVGLLFWTPPKGNLWQAG